MSFDETKNVPWQPRVKAYLWFAFMGFILFITFAAIRASIPTPQWNVLTRAEWGMTIVWLLVVTCTYIFSKIYFAFNPEADQSIANMVRLNYKESGKLREEISQLKIVIQENSDLLETYVTELPSKEKK